MTGHQGRGAQASSPRMAAAAGGTRDDAMRALESEFSELLGHLRRIHVEAAGKVSPGLQVGSYKTFLIIARREGITPSALAEHLMIDKGQLSRAVRQLEDLGLVERRTDPSDGRSSLLFPTASGTRKLAESRAPYNDRLFAILDDWDLTDIEQLAVLLRALRTGERPPVRR